MAPHQLKMELLMLDNEEIKGKVSFASLSQITCDKAKEWSHSQFWRFSLCVGGLTL